ncbi:uncharacterized protein MONBRDRAFT_32793 [Monosiga brevicollis MX1]|uniref:Multifunctional methyltransferase subunit TRM112-like protein n=1 Tax=Monosiga brevicollis TaxID=81824 RepID=A9V1Q7_MONBE|nr:uncharacterized protein MONBRDRAFT_32793 [Monosiga brevicollis MX1]EDQ88604.1 predicted protein [Monosiga brevicollis MX1]|eukprot:XP_001746708.1 hypothetical protein [Monosiga brevicollis MX1]
MKLLTHNMLKSHVKGVKDGYPLRLSASKVELKEVTFNADFVVRMLDRIVWPVLRQTAIEIGQGDNLPTDIPADAATNEEFLRAMHHVLLEVLVLEGELECPETGRKFPIKKGIPNMLLDEDEV